jgi:multidrug efflux pump
MAEQVLQDPAVQSLSSFIGVDGANATLNAGRMLINLKPKAQRDASIDEVVRRMANRPAKVPGIELYLQPVQDLTIEDRVAKTQYQFLLSSPDGERAGPLDHATGGATCGNPKLADVASDQQNQGLQAYVEIDRGAASRPGGDGGGH